MSDPWIAAMRRGDHGRAFQINDAVLQARLARGEVPDDPARPYHERFVWTGRRLAGRCVLVRCHHGLGDTLMAARFLAPLAGIARRVTVEAPLPLVPFLAGLPDFRVVPFDHAAPLPPDEVDVEIMELGHALRLGPRDATPSAPPVVPATIASGSVGFCWRAGDWLADRSVPLAALAPVLRGSGRALVSLQHGPALREARRRFPDLLQGPGRPDDTVERTASLVAGAAVVVTVDTMLAHLALLLGRRTIVLLKRDPDWRWGEPGGGSPWYPDAVLLRQERDGDWTPVLARLRALLLRPDLPRGEG